jgi:hypothetical protein
MKVHTRFRNAPFLVKNIFVARTFSATHILRLKYPNTISYQLQIIKSKLYISSIDMECPARIYVFHIRQPLFSPAL